MVKIGHYILYYYEGIFCLCFLQVFYLYFVFFIALCCLSRIITNAVKLLDDVLADNYQYISLSLFNDVKHKY